MRARSRILDVIVFGFLVASIAFFGYRMSRRGFEPLELVEVQPGDTLSDIPLQFHTMDLRVGTTRIAELLDQDAARCAVLIFFNPTCRFCEKMAPLWSGVGYVEADSVRLPVYWISTDADHPENDAFLVRHSLPRPWYALPNIWREGALIGVNRWPLLYVVEEGRVFRGEAPRDPEELIIPETCAD